MYHSVSWRKKLAAFAIQFAALGFAAPIPLICLARQHCNELKTVCLAVLVKPWL
jgi:hypothetical protein